MKKIYFGLLSIVSILLSILFLLNSGYNFSSVSANPDYICVKDVYDMPCEISSCGPWGTDGKRTCTGKKTTQVAYYLIRTTCEPGYTQIRNCTTQCYPNPKYHCVDNVYNYGGLGKILGGGKKLGGGKNCYGGEPQICYKVCGNVLGDSGRQGADYPNKTESCSVIQIDNVAPEGEAVSK